MGALREFCWEAGRPRWVIHGTPASGAGILGCLEAGCSVVALCFDDHHRTRFSKFVLERAVEAMVAGTTVAFKDDALQARSVQLSLTTAAKAASVDQTATPEGKEESEVKPKKRRTDKKRKALKAKAKATQKKQEAAKVTASDSAASDTTSDAASSETPPAKKTKRQ
jgi:hypothetical protein